jgi:hypothetical protein
MSSGRALCPYLEPDEARMVEPSQAKGGRPMGSWWLDAKTGMFGHFFEEGHSVAQRPHLEGSHLAGRGTGPVGIRPTIASATVIDQGAPVNAEGLRASPPEKAGALLAPSGLILLAAGQRHRAEHGSVDHHCGRAPLFLTPAGRGEHPERRLPVPLCRGSTTTSRIAALRPGSGHRAPPAIGG